MLGHAALLLNHAQTELHDHAHRMNVNSTVDTIGRRPRPPGRRRARASVRWPAPAAAAATPGTQHRCSSMHSRSPTSCTSAGVQRASSVGGDSECLVAEQHPPHNNTCVLNFEECGLRVEGRTLISALDDKEADVRCFWSCSARKARCRASPPLSAAEPPLHLHGSVQAGLSTGGRHPINAARGQKSMVLVDWRTLAGTPHLSVAVLYCCHSQGHIQGPSAQLRATDEQQVRGGQLHAELLS